MKRICIITGAHLCRNPRVVKEATSLGEAGYDVSVVAPLISDALMEDDAAILTNAPFKRIVSIDVRESRGLTGLVGRARRRLANEVNVRFSSELAAELGYGVRAALRKARSVDADLYIGHQETGAWVCWKLMQEGRQVGADLEDWYSRDLPPEARRGRPLELLDRCEGDLVRQAAHVTTTSAAMADAMADAYGKRPDVIYNSFPFGDRVSLDGLRKDRQDEQTPSLFWFSQTIGPGRGLELLVDALEGMSRPVQLHLRGSPVENYDRELIRRLGERSPHTIAFHSLVSPNELLSRIAEHDIGLALEATAPPSRDLTITNKILQYLLGGLAVVATRTSGQVEIARVAPGSVRLVDQSVDDLRSALVRMISETDTLIRAKAEAVSSVQNDLSWEIQAGRLLSLVERSLTAR